jgi:mRNA-degrading endonuclease toxin of MazEF toxin-antitoxin module
MNVGDVVWIEFPPGAGRAQAGRRPAIVAQTSQVSAALPMVLVIPLSGQQDALRFPGTVLVEPDADNGLRRLSVALVFQLTAIDKKFLGAQLGTVSKSVMAEVWEVLHEITGR